MTRELKLKTLIIENFIPAEDRMKLEKRIYKDDDEDTYKIRPLANAAKWVAIRLLFAVLCSLVSLNPSIFSFILIFLHYHEKPEGEVFFCFSSDYRIYLVFCEPLKNSCATSGSCFTS